MASNGSLVGRPRHGRMMQMPMTNLKRVMFRVCDGSRVLGTAHQGIAMSSSWLPRWVSSKTLLPPQSHHTELGDTSGTRILHLSRLVWHIYIHCFLQSIGYNVSADLNSNLKHAFIWIDWVPMIYSNLSEFGGKTTCRPSPWTKQPARFTSPRTARAG